jgi:glycosyltransferase involved in cell wall biosynthesis
MMKGTGEPFVSVGIPTYNHAEMLRRAVESVLAQHYRNIEVVISDNASTDGTRALCDELCRRDGRVRYVRQPVNIGLTANFSEAFKVSRGAFYMVLPDDDWLDPSYISQCVRTLQEDPELAAACGKPRMYRGMEFSFEGACDNLLQKSGEQRIVTYFKRVWENPAIHGLMRREMLVTVPPMQNTFAGDWIYIASVAFKGRIKTVDSALINKSLGGVSSSWERSVRTLGLPSYQAKIRGLPYLIILWSVFKDIAWASPVYRSLGRVARFSLACRACWVLVVKFTRFIAGFTLPIARGYVYRFVSGHGSR